MACDLIQLVDAMQSNNPQGVRNCLSQGYPHGQTIAFSTNSALHHAAQSNNTDFIDWLVVAGGDVNGQNSLGQTALHTAVYNESVPNCVCLVRNGASLQAKDKWGYSARDIAKSIGSTSCMAVLDSLVAGQHIEAMLDGNFSKRRTNGRVS